MAFRVEPATERDLPLILKLIKDLAEYVTFLIIEARKR
jgi:hypothetical protein